MQLRLSLNGLADRLRFCDHAGRIEVTEPALQFPGHYPRALGWDPLIADDTD